MTLKNKKDTLATKYNFDDFTESHYESLLTLAKENYSFESFTSKKTTPHILWRHDIDLSVHRALKLAEIEVKQNIQATYFFLLHSEFYNLFEKNVFARANEIIKMGHHLGLHFDISFYTDIRTMVDLEKKILFEKQILENLFSTQLNVFSFHNPTTQAGYHLNCDRVAGIINAYGQSIMTNYHYWSDTNGYWRYQRLHDILADKTIAKLQVLTHPGWWTPQILSPRERISRCIDGRAQATHKNYDELLLKYHRENVGLELCE